MTFDQFLTSLINGSICFGIVYLSAAFIAFDGVKPVCEGVPLQEPFSDEEWIEANTRPIQVEESLQPSVGEVEEVTESQAQPLHLMTVTLLRAVAKERKIPRYGKMNKAQLLNVLDE